MDSPRLTALQFQRSAGVDDWRVLSRGAFAWFAAPSHAAGAELAARAVAAGADAGAVPDVDVRASGVRVRIAHGEGGLTEASIASAHTISAAARELGLMADPSILQAVQLTIDTAQPEAMMQFWQSALRYDAPDDRDVVDPLSRNPSIWFQEMDTDRPLRNRLHIDIGVAPDVARDRIDAIIAAGGEVVRQSDFHAAIADPDGNEIDVVPLQLEGDLAEVPERSDWRVLFCAMVHYPTSNPAVGAQLAAAVAEIADDVGIDLSIDLRPSGVTVDSGKDRWDHERFPELATRVQAAARALGLVADPVALRFVQIGIDAVDVPAVREFWRAVLGYELDTRPFITDIFDPHQHNVPLFFQPTEADDAERLAQRNRTHVDVFVPEDQADARIAAAIAAGGRVVYDAEAPDWWTLADPEGNEVDIAVAVGRHERWLAQQHG